MFNRRQWMIRALHLPAGAWMARYNALTAQDRRKVKITAIKAMQVKGIAGNCLIRVETDSGLTGYGEAGATGPIARARIQQITSTGMLLGQDPLSIEKHFHEMTTRMYTYRPHIPTISGIDIALWDLAGKITGQPVNYLLGGPFRDSIQLYSHGGGADPLDPAACRAWVDRVKAAPEGFTAFKVVFSRIAGIQGFRESVTLSPEQVRRVERAMRNLKEAAGDSIDIALHCHGEMDVPSSIQVAKAIEPYNPLFYEDPMQVLFSDGWRALRRSTRLTILTGEKLELLREFREFIDAQVTDIIHPDLAFSGGLTGTKKIAEYAQTCRIPVALHNVGSLILCYASAHFGSAIHNFYRSESALGRPNGAIEKMSAAGAPTVKNSHLTVPTAPGLGFVPNEEFLKTQLEPGEPFWS
ncbi:MAG: mandelate racemase/muconate lactonizing enzyme family protein [Acidobacteria bacterium]|nr:mandelate racemase/muconate lactonizing enzyme family protein [Acidobacteriota bacterium]